MRAFPGLEVLGLALVWGHCIECTDWAPNRRFAGSVGALFFSGRWRQTLVGMFWASGRSSSDPRVFALMLSSS